MHSLASKLTTDPTDSPRACLRKATRSAQGPKLDPVEAIALRCIERMLGHPATRDDTPLLPGIDVSDLT